MASKAGPSTPRHRQVPFDPPGDVVMTGELRAWLEEGKRPMLNNYLRYAKIGRGFHGKVYLCYLLDSRLPINDPHRRIPVAMKSVKRVDEQERKRNALRKGSSLPTTKHTPVADTVATTERRIRKEIAIMKKCRHPHVVRLYEVIDDRMRDKIYMVMEYMGGGEVQWTNGQDEPVLTLPQTRRIIRDALLGLEYLHYQGIIHRDIKPANLLWTEDRRQVKIVDFGVSHFSYAQRLAAAGKNATFKNDPEDPILLNESDLSKRAGTPSFLAPELVYMEEISASGSASTSLSPSPAPESLCSPTTVQPATSPTRPPITKAIDVWALGVTLYCLLFGKLPFNQDSTYNSEWSIYKNIRESDWPVPETMGSEHIPTGGRRPNPANEGALVIHLLDRLLQKEIAKRITLDDVKRHPWILQDLENPEHWLRVTSPSSTNRIDVSTAETSDAMSAVHFKWGWSAGVTRKLTSLFRNVRTRSPDRGNPHNRPTTRKKNFASATELEPLVTTSLPGTVMKRDKGKKKAETRSPKQYAKALRSKSIEKWPLNRGPSENASSSTAIQGLPLKARRGSETSSQASPTTFDKPRGGRIASLFTWRSRYSPAGPSPVGNANPSSFDPRITRGVPGNLKQGGQARRSEEALRNIKSAQAVQSATLTAARRASSWGQGDQIRWTDEIISISSFDMNDQDTPGDGGSSSERQPNLPHVSSRLASSSKSMTAPHQQRQHPFDMDSSDLERFGPPGIDEDDSTIASLELEDDDYDDAVTFSPKKRR